MAVGKAAADEKAAAAPPLTGEDDGGDDVGEEGEEEIQVLDAVEVLVASDDYEEEEALAMEAEEVTLVYNARRGKEAREGEHAPRRRGASRWIDAACWRIIAWCCVWAAGCTTSGQFCTVSRHILKRDFVCLF